MSIFFLNRQRRHQQDPYSLIRKKRGDLSPSNELHERLIAEKERIESKRKILRGAEVEEAKTTSSIQDKNVNHEAKAFIIASDDTGENISYDTEKLNSNSQEVINNTTQHSNEEEIECNNHVLQTASSSPTFYENLKQRIHWIIADPPEGHKLGECVTAFILLLITANVIVSILETEQHLYDAHRDFFYYFELVSVMIFTVEYVLTIWSCTVVDRFQHPFFGRIKAMLQFMAIVDLLAIAPFYINLALSATSVDLRFLRTLRLFRLFRLFRHGKMREGFGTLTEVVKSQREQLTLGMYLLILFVLLFSSSMFIIESESKFAPTTKFTSIPATMWWGVITMTTIGYGDMAPESTLGKIFASLVGYLGICVIALPLGIIGNGFTEYMDEIEKRENETLLKSKMNELKSSSSIRMQQIFEQMENLQVALKEIDEAMTVLKESLIVDQEEDEITDEIYKKMTESAPSSSSSSSSPSSPKQQKHTVQYHRKESDTTDTIGSSSNTLNKKEEGLFNNNNQNENYKNDNDIEVCSCPHCGRLYL